MKKNQIKGVIKECEDCNDLFELKELKSWKYEPEVKLCDNCYDERLDEEQQDE